MTALKNLLWSAIIVFFVSCSSSSQAPKQETAAPSSEPAAAARPAPPEFSPNKKRLLNYLADQYGQFILSGQMDTSWTTNKEMDMITRVFTDTGKYPAVKGFDFIEVNTNYAPFLGGREQINEAIEWWEGMNNGAALLPGSPNIHGIVTFCWHWRAGDRNDFYTDKTRFRIPWKGGKLDTESEDFKSIMYDLNVVATRLNTLKEKDIPVLWRPLHEASGGWFWWGASLRKPYIALWEYMYDFFTYEKGLNNLIWVWNGQSAEWFPDPATVEIVGVDLYRNNYSSMKNEFEKAVSMAPQKDMMVALTENDRIPDPDTCKEEGTMWSWFLTWNDRFGSQQGDSHKDNFWTGEYHNTQERKMKVYHHPLVITLDELPDLTAYRLD